MGLWCELDGKSRGLLNPLLESHFKELTKRVKFYLSELLSSCEINMWNTRLSRTTNRIVGILRARQQRVFHAPFIIKMEDLHCGETQGSKSKTQYKTSIQREA